MTNNLPLIVLLLVVLLPSVLALGVRLVLIAIHHGEEPEPPPNARPIFRSRRNRWILYSGLTAWGLAIIGCLAWWAAVDLAPRLGIRVSAPFLAWGIVWIIVFPAYFIRELVLIIRRSWGKYPRPAPEVSEEERRAWKDKVYEEIYKENTPKKMGTRLLVILLLAILMGLSAWIISLFEH